MGDSTNWSWKVMRIIVLISLSVSLMRSEDQCLLNRKSRLVDSYHPHTRFPRSAPAHGHTKGNDENRMVYLDGNDHLLKLTEPSRGNTVPNGRQSMHTVFPREQFTVTVWAKPEGGQFENAVLLGKF